MASLVTTTWRTRMHGRALTSPPVLRLSLLFLNPRYARAAFNRVVQQTRLSADRFLFLSSNIYDRLNACSRNSPRLRIAIDPSEISCSSSPPPRPPLEPRSKRRSLHLPIRVSESQPRPPWRRDAETPGVIVIIVRDYSRHRANYGPSLFLGFAYLSILIIWITRSTAHARQRFSWYGVSGSPRSLGKYSLLELCPILSRVDFSLSF